MKSNSRRSLTFPFNTDLTDCLLTILPDFQSLQAFISSSKFVYSVFRCRQSSILRAVAHRRFGPAFPPAIHLVRYLCGTGSSELIPEPHPDFAHNFTITPAQVRLLQDHSTTVRELEDIYSWWEKDPRSRSSRLSAAESLRFQQSVYRFWLLAAFHGPSALGWERPDYSNGDYLQLKNSIVTKQMVFLLSLGETGLLGVGEIHRFLLDLAKWATVKHNTRPTRLCDRDGICLAWSGPAVTLDAVRGKWSSFRPIESQWCDTWRTLTHAFFASEIVTITRGVLPTIQEQFILEDRFLKTVCCSQCEESPSLSRRVSLWSPCNWEYMVLVLAPLSFGSFLSFEKRRPLELLVSFSEEIESIPYTQFIGEIFDIRSERYKGWRKGDWLCTRCMTKLLSDNIQTWFNRRRMEADASNGSLTRHSGG